MYNKIKEIFFKQRDKVRRKFNRVLPFADYFNDRWEKAEYLGFGKGSSIYDSSLVFGDVKVGENCWVGPFTILDGSASSLCIGNNCDISAGVQIYTHDTVAQTLGKGKGNRNERLVNSQVTIGHNCYIGPNVIISKGVTIGDFVVVGANSFVNKNIPSNSKAFGNPVKIIGTINDYS